MSNYAHSLPKQAHRSIRPIEVNAKTSVADQHKRWARNLGRRQKVSLNKNLLEVLTANMSPLQVAILGAIFTAAAIATIVSAILFFTI
jgi:hypothetical protein